MNWHLSRFGCFVLDCCVLLCFDGFAFGFCSDCVTSWRLLDYAQVLYQFTLKVPQSADAMEAQKFYSKSHSSCKGADRVSKSLLISGVKTNPLDKARCCFQSNRKISKCGNTSPVHCQIWSVQRCNFFRQETDRVVLTLPKVPPLHPGFSRFLTWMLLC